MGFLRESVAAISATHQQSSAQVAAAQFQHAGWNRDSVAFRDAVRTEVDRAWQVERHFDIRGPKWRRSLASYGAMALTVASMALYATKASRPASTTYGLIAGSVVLAWLCFVPFRRHKRAARARYSLQLITPVTNECLWIEDPSRDYLDAHVWRASFDAPILITIWREVDWASHRFSSALENVVLRGRGRAITVNVSFTSDPAIAAAGLSPSSMPTFGVVQQGVLTPWDRFGKDGVAELERQAIRSATDAIHHERNVTRR